MIHITLHFIVPLLVDADHLLADPIYDPTRSSIGFHPLHSIPAIVVYAARVVHLMGFGLLIHMALDWLDCF